MNEKPKRKREQMQTQVIWLTSFVAVLWAIGLGWAYMTSGADSFSGTSTPSYEAIASVTAQNYVILGTDVPYCDYVSEGHIEPELSQAAVDYVFYLFPKIIEAKLIFHQASCFDRPLEGEQANNLVYYRSRQEINITLSDDAQNDFDLGVSINSVFDRLYELQFDPKTIIRVVFVDDAGNEVHSWQRNYESGLDTIAQYAGNPEALWQSIGR
ncbi:MAG: hypothetical protein KC546_10520 [Anaerolineae bacterium]|nr:hypothetical protein [Anaerolineae bacterium]MCA9894012.1 hypothetical protein [Anaerolineae bacterium]